MKMVMMISSKEGREQRYSFHGVQRPNELPMKRLSSKSLTFSTRDIRTASVQLFCSLSGLFNDEAQARGVSYTCQYTISCHHNLGSIPLEFFSCFFDSLTNGEEIIIHVRGEKKKTDSFPLSLRDIRPQPFSSASLSHVRRRQQFRV